MSPLSVTVRVPAKINLQLSVGPLGGDGYHPLATIFQAVSLYDDVTASRRPAGSGMRLAVRGPDASDIPLGPSNLAARAAAALADYLALPPDVSLLIRKGIPVAGGMAGGSADAAAALVACDALWDSRLPRAELQEIAATLGADVPFLLLGGTAIGTGRGDQLTPVLAAGRYQWVIATAHEGLSTPLVYRRFDELWASRAVAQPAIDNAVLGALRSGNPGALAAAMTNNLQPAAIALRPVLQAVLDTGLAAGALGGIVSGSGPTVAFLVADDSAAMEITMALSPSGLCQSLRQAHGPVPGARITAA